MFEGATSFNQSLSTWAIAAVIRNLTAMFKNATSFNSPIGARSNTLNATGMASMFEGASSFNQPLSALGTTNVLDMSNMFSGATNFNQPLTTNGNYRNVAKVTNMAGMFQNASAFDQSLMSWNIAKVADMSKMLINTHLSIVNYNEALSGRSVQAVQSGVVFDATPTQYGGCGTTNAKRGIAGHASLIATGHWTIDDGGAVECSSFRPFIMTRSTQEKGTTLTIPTLGAGYDFEVNWNYANNPDNFDGPFMGNVTTTYPKTGDYQVAIRGLFPRMYLYNGGAAPAIANASHLTSIIQWGDIERKNMAQAFQNATNLSILAEDTPNLTRVTDMTSMFNGATNLTGNFENWDTSRITTMTSLFQGATNFNQPLASWDTSKVTNMTSMFQNASSFNQPLTTNGSLRDVSKVTNMSNMFNGATSFSQSLASWEPVSVILGGFANFLANAKLSTFNYNALLDSRSQQPLLTAQPFNGGRSQYGGCVENTDAGLSGHSLLMSSLALSGKLWTFTDGGLDVTCGRPFITTWQTTGANQVITIPVDTALFYNVDVDWGDGSASRFVGTGTATALQHTYAVASGYTVTLYGIFPRINFNNGASRLNIRSVIQWGDPERTTMENAFYGAENLAILADDAPNLERVSSLASMFRGATHLRGNFGNWDTSTITNMTYLFQNATDFNSPLTNWDTSNVTNMSYMFQNASSFNQPLTTNEEKWNVEKVLDFRYMLNGASAFDQDLSSRNPIAVITKANFTSLLQNTNLSLFNYNALLDGWSQKPIMTGATAFNVSPTRYGGCGIENAEAGIAGRSILTSSIASGGKAWAITDGGLSPACSRPFITTWTTTGDNETITIPVDTALTYNFQINWGDEGADKNVQVYNQTNPVITHTYASSGLHTVSIMGTFPRILCSNNVAMCGKLQSIDQWGDIAWTSMLQSFYSAVNLNIKAEDLPILSGVTTMQGMFSGAINLTGNFSGWDTSKITTMTNMFTNATNFDQDLSSWIVSGVLVGNFANMFNGTQLSLFNYNAILDSRSQQNVKTSVTAFTLS
jgi:surface protein